MNQYERSSYAVHGILASIMQLTPIDQLGVSRRNHDEKLSIKRYGIAGVSGQCLMSPPEPVDTIYQYKLYYLGGSITNLLTSAAFLLLFVLLRDIFHYARETFLPIAFVGVLLGLFNILPLKVGGLAVDGHNLFALGKNEHTRRANWLLLTIVARLASGERSRDFPAEWFEFDEGYDFNDAIMANVASMGINRLIDSRDFEQAKILAERILCEGGKLIELLKNETRCDLLFLAIIDESGQNREDEIAGLFTPELKKYIKASKTQLSKHRLMYAYEKLVSFDGEKAIKSLESFDKAHRSHPYSGDRESERELIDIVDRLAEIFSKQKIMNSEIKNHKNWKKHETKISNLFFWGYSGEVNSSFLNEEVYFVLIGETNDINQFDFDYISFVAKNIDIFIENAIIGIKKELEKKPEMFGIKQEQIIHYLNFSNKEFPVSGTHITFYTDKEMFLQFYEADFPNIDYGLGIGINFKNDAIISIDIPESDESTIIKEDLI